jgi:hypothetical protein
VLNSVYALKVKKLEAMRSSINTEIKTAHEEGKDTTDLMVQLLALEEAKKQFNKLLGRIIIR